MEIKKIICSSEKHEEMPGIYYCPECKIYMCNKCENHHSELFQKHHQYKLDKDTKDIIFTGFCKEENHLDKLEYFCKTHNQLCCASCIAKIKKKGKSQHTDCDVCLIEDIKPDKKNKLNENIKNLEELSNKLEESINKIKIILENMSEKKEDLKLKIQKIFTKIRNTLNEREDFLLLEVDKQYEKIFLNENIIKESEKLPFKVKISLEKGKIINNEWDNDNKLNSLINDCINIENNIKEINIINENIKKCNNSNDMKVTFSPDEESKINEFLEKITSFGRIGCVESNLNIMNLNSKIIDNNEYKKILKNWINPQKIIKAELLYRLSENGEKISDFHLLCDNKGPTLTLFYVKEGNNKVGIYTPLSFDTNSEWKKDKETFIFNLNQKKKYKKIIDNYSLYCGKATGPYTDYFGIKNYNMKILFYNSSSINNTYENGKEILKSKESKTYDLIETEVFKLIFVN